MSDGFRRSAIARGERIPLHRSGFLRNGTNRREDSYGGPVENRIRMLIEVTETLIKKQRAPIGRA